MDADAECNTSSWFERLTMTVILVNCVTLGMYQPCEDTTVCDQKCKLLKVLSRKWFINYIKFYAFQIIDDVIYVYFVAEMLIKMVKDTSFLRMY